MREIIVEVSLNGDNAPDVRVLRKRELFLELQGRGMSDEDLETLNIRLDNELTVRSHGWHDLFYYKIDIPIKPTVKNSTGRAKKSHP